MYIIDDDVLDLSQGCDSCPLRTGKDECKLLDWEINDVVRYSRSCTRPEFCPIKHIPGSPRIIFVNELNVRTIQEYHPELQRPGLVKKVVYLEDLKNATLDIGKKL